jgi:hypothetical protein
MSEFLDTLRERHVDAQRRLQASQTRLQTVQNEHNALIQEANGWAHAFAAESRREQFEAQRRQATSPTQAPTPEILPPAAKETNNSHALMAPPAAINKTQLIRNVLQQNPAGMKPVAVWIQVRDQIDRPYVYSVLSRMKEKKQVIERKGKYFLPKPVEINEKEATEATS